MKSLPSRLRRLDDALADLPLDEPMLLTELDGFLHGVLLCSDPIPQAEWFQSIWGSDESGIAPFEDPLDVQWFVDAVMARHAEIVRDLDRGKPRPIFDTDERNGDVLWDLWIDGFAEAMTLRPETWEKFADGNDADSVEAFSRLNMLIAVAREESDLDSVEINALQDQAPADIIRSVSRLYAVRSRAGGEAQATPGSERAVKIGRNDPCPCGSGKKYKRCCGLEAIAS